MLIERSIELHRASIQPSTGRAIGAYKSDVIALEARLGNRLPEAYREFLLWMGADFHGVFKGSDCFITQIEDNAAALSDLFIENELPEISYQPLVFFMHQGYFGCWFDFNTPHDDPTVFFYNESEHAAGVRILGRFSDWLFAELSALSTALE